MLSINASALGFQTAFDGFQTAVAVSQSGNSRVVAQCREEWYGRAFVLDAAVPDTVRWYASGGSASLLPPVPFLATYPAATGVRCSFPVSYQRAVTPKTG